MLSKIRITLATLCLAGFVLLFFTPGAPDVFPGLELLAKVQLLPAVLSGSIAIVAVLMLLTLLFGRVYCSVLCPLGLLQDLLARIAPARRFRFRPAARRFRIIVLLLCIAAIAAGLPVLFSLLEPYSVFGRMAANAATAGRALWSAASGSDTPLPWSTGFVPLTAALVSFALIAFVALKYGRLWCTAVCPVGTLLGYLSRFALFRIRIDTARCAGCGRCEKVCKSSCIDVGTHTVDTSRCVACFNCLSVCRHQAVAFSLCEKNSGLPDK